MELADTVQHSDHSELDLDPQLLADGTVALLRSMQQEMDGGGASSSTSASQGNGGQDGAAVEYTFVNSGPGLPEPYDPDDTAATMAFVARQIYSQQHGEEEDFSQQKSRKT